MQLTLYRHSKLDFLLALLGIGTTLFAFSMFVWETFYSHSGFFQNAGLFEKIETFLFLGIVMFLIYGNLVYQFTRQAYFSRKATHSPTPRLELESWYNKRSAPWVTILVPAFKEEPGVVYQTLLSAALQDYHHCRIVLLIDDPSHPTARKDQENLTALRALPHHIQELLDSQKAQIDKAFSAFREREQKGLSHFDGEVGHLIHLFQEIQSWFHQQTFSIEGDSHTNRWFVQNILLVHNEHLEKRAATLQRHQTSKGEKLSQVIHQEYRFLKALFSCEISSFERKRYRNLSHEPNKAMNLNTYMGLMGQTLFEEKGQEGLVLKRSSKKKDTWHIPDAKYVLTLDADSLILPDYTLRLVHFMEQPQHHRVAVAQTPYSAIPDAPNLIERIAGATTDIQYITHQGFTQYEGTYWVGANALLRKSALKEIARKSGDPNLPTIKFIQDRTVIEDTESSIDLIVRGWKLYNYPERLAYSATPPDFGALLIQRRRWANGGLLIFPNLLRYLFNQPMRWRTIKEGLMRGHYLLSITSVNVGLVLLLFYPFDNQMNSLWLPLTALPYFALYGRDLTLMGYQWRDLPRVYAINLLLVPVHLGGVIQSLRQALTGQKTPFCRTPKVLGRTSVPALYIGVVYGMVVLLLVGTVHDYLHQYWLHLAFASMNAGFLMYSVFRYVGIHSSIEDLQLFTNQYNIPMYKSYLAAFLWSETSSQPNPTKMPEKVPGGIPD